MAKDRGDAAFLPLSIETQYDREELS